MTSTHPRGVSRIFVFLGPKGPGVQSKTSKMTTHTQGVMERMLKEMLMDYQIVDRTHAFPVGAPSSMKYEEIMLLPTAQRKELKTKCTALAATECPYGSYPCHVKGPGWCQLSFMKESVDIHYDIYGHHVAVDIRVESKRADHKVVAWARSEEYDAFDRCMQLQPNDEGWVYITTIEKVKGFCVTTEGIGRSTTWSC